MYKLGVKADMETLEQYSLTFCNLSEPELLIKKLQDIGYTVKDVLTSVLVVLLSQQQLQEAQSLCKIIFTTTYNNVKNALRFKNIKTLYLSR